MIRTAIVVALVVTPGLEARVAARPGRVVRVERHARTSSYVPRWCDVSADEDVGVCRGPRPNLGDTITVVSTTGIAAEIRVSEVDATPCAMLWKIRTRLLRGDFSTTPSWIALIDPSLDSRSRLIPADKVTSPSRRSSDEVQFAIDRDGDGREDVVGVNYLCDDSGVPDASASGDCYDVYQRSGNDVTRVHPTLLPSCASTP